MVLGELYGSCVYMMPCPRQAGMAQASIEFTFPDVTAPGRLPLHQKQLELSSPKRIIVNSSELASVTFKTTVLG